MQKKSHATPSGIIRYWISDADPAAETALVFLPGLTADHRLFDLQTEYFRNRFKVLVWDAPGHAASHPFRLDFDLFDEAKWLDEILMAEGIAKPILIGQSMGGYLGQVYANLFPQKLAGLMTIDSPPIQKRYYTAIELWLLKKTEPIYRLYPWKALLKAGSSSVSSTEYGRKLMLNMMRVYDGDQARYARLAGHGYRMLAAAVEQNLPDTIQCAHIVICGKEDRAGSCVRYLKAYERNTKHAVHWIDHAGHNANTDQPKQINMLIERLAEQCAASRQD